METKVSHESSRLVLKSSLSNISCQFQDDDSTSPKPSGVTAIKLQIFKRIEPAKMQKPTKIEIAEKIRQASIEAAQEGFKEASMSGLCSEGAMEAAIGAIQSLNLQQLLVEELGEEE
jgi:hypothetical protein